MKKVLLAISTALILICGLSGCEQSGNEPNPMVNTKWVKETTGIVTDTYSYVLEFYSDKNVKFYTMNGSEISDMWMTTFSYTYSNGVVTFGSNSICNGLWVYKTARVEGTMLIVTDEDGIDSYFVKK